MDVERHRTQRHGPTEVQQHLDDAVDAVDLLQQHVDVLAPAGFVAQLALQQLDGAADRAERVADLVGQPHGDLARRGQGLAAAHLGFELMQARDVAHHGHRRRDRAAPAGDRRRDDAHVNRAAVRPFDDGLRLRAALTGRQRVAEMTDQRRVGREELLQGPAERATRRASEQRLGGRIPEHDAKVLSRRRRQRPATPSGALRSRAGSSSR